MPRITNRSAATVFDVYVNDRKLCRAGVGSDGVLNAIVSWVRLSGEAARTARRQHAPREETRLHVGGLANNTHRRWDAPALKPGDRVTIQVARASTFDRPAFEAQSSPARTEEQERRYYERLKARFEGTGTASTQPKPPAPASRSDETRFLNVDLDVWSKTPLDELATGFGRHAIVHVGREGRRYGAHLELIGSGTGSARSCARTLRRFADAITRLPPAARRAWKGATLRQFNIGVQSAAEPHSYELALPTDVLRDIAKLDARVVLTVYACQR
jgi:hypothetical protein